MFLCFLEFIGFMCFEFNVCKKKNDVDDDVVSGYQINIHVILKFIGKPSM